MLAIALPILAAPFTFWAAFRTSSSEAYTEALEEAESEAAALEYAEVMDTVGGDIAYDANRILCWYCASQDKSVDNISIPHLAAMVTAHK